ncbi:MULTISPECIES: alpha/beta hydrolase [unclassified Mesorhizobium]|uniref:alpha/beta fold hydrolase n=1 Tax=unclassified Mesorhizobium TaxID=325217 RepID=UPI001FDFF848|nr:MULTISPECIES: alpha/beta hydrolase [unclassified Mesorhizobium]
MSSAALAPWPEQEAWASRKRVIDLDGLEMAYVEFAGSEPALLLVHGFTDTSRSFSLLAPHLAGRRLVIPDLRGHGASLAGRGYGIGDFASDLAGLVRNLRLERPVVVGHSLGAMIALELAARQPELIGGLVLLAGTLKPDLAVDHPMVAGVRELRDPISPADPFYAWWHACQPGVPRAFLAAAAKEASAMPASRWRTLLDEIRGTDLTAAARALRVAALVIGGGRDPIFDATHQRRLAEEIPAARLVAAAHCGHNPHWEDPTLVAATISDYVQTRTEGGQSRMGGAVSRRGRS